MLRLTAPFMSLVGVSLENDCNGGEVVPYPQVLSLVELLGAKLTSNDHSVGRNPQQ